MFGSLIFNFFSGLIVFNHEGEERRSKKRLTIIIVSTLGAISVFLLVGFGCYIYLDRRKTRKMAGKFLII